MEIKYKKIFLKELKKLPVDYRRKIENLVFNKIKDFDEKEIYALLSKMTGYSDYYKIRIGDYRIGVKILGNILEFQRVLHRREIYRYFP